MDMKITFAAAGGDIRADVSLPSRNPPGSIHLYLRHPDGKRMKSVRVNGRDWREFDAATGRVTMPGTAGKVAVVATYE